MGQSLGQSLVVARPVYRLHFGRPQGSPLRFLILRENGLALLYIRSILYF
ncbi:hypothetical protein MNB_SUP05-SYMBIONT-7-319 [hydrothermal vent metagenome]|uniref:Uncharacterized protein n=1 Tax=hydrothermal vent metagenome TaxID=652676 RepID=A0A1W1E388_9ZZZZ